MPELMSVTERCPLTEVLLYTIVLFIAVHWSPPSPQIVAQDPDTGLNAVVSYSLLPSVEPFTINPNTGTPHAAVGVA